MADSEQLLLIDIVIAGGAVALQTVRATTGDRRAGRRRTDVERFADPASMRHRLGELVAWIDDPLAPAAAAG